MRNKFVCPYSPPLDMSGRLKTILDKLLFRSVYFYPISDVDDEALFIDHFKSRFESYVGRYSYIGYIKSGKDALFGYVDYASINDDILLRMSKRKGTLFQFLDYHKSNHNILIFANSYIGTVSKSVNGKMFNYRDGTWTNNCIKITTELKNTYGGFWMLLTLILVLQLFAGLKFKFTEGSNGLSFRYNFNSTATILVLTLTALWHLFSIAFCLVSRKYTMHAIRHWLGEEISKP